MTRTALRVGTKVVKESMRAAPAVKKAAAKKRPVEPSANWILGVAIGGAGPRRYRLYKPPGVKRTERLPLLVMLHGCGQDAEALASSSRMNRIAARERFFVLYPEQDRMANIQGCWNWYDTRSGRAQGEAGAIDAAINQVCLTQAIDPARIALAGISAGAGMAALLATLHPERFKAIVMHSGIAPGVAHSTSGALRAMRGRRTATPPLPKLPVLIPVKKLPPLLVIQGSLDYVVASSNGPEAVQRWATRVGAKPGKARRVQRGKRYPATITDYRSGGRLVASLCEVIGLGHAWSGGAAGQAFSDPKGPDASRMIWTFAAKQFADAEK